MTVFWESNDASLPLPATLRPRYSCGDTEYPLLLVSVITMLLGDIGHEAAWCLVVRSPGTDHTWPCVKVISAAHARSRHRQQYDFFSMNRPTGTARGKSREYRQGG